MTLRVHHILIVVIGFGLGFGFLAGTFLRSPSVFGAPPANVTNVVPSPGNGQVSLQWTNPADVGFTGTMVRYSTTAFPTSASDGTLASDVAGSPSGLSSLNVTGLVNGKTYFFSLFAHNVTPEYSAAVNAQQVVMATAFSDDFQSETLGGIHGQNGWFSLGGTWTVIDTAGEKTLQSSSTNVAFEINRTLNGGNVGTYSDQMVRVDWKGTTAVTPGQVFLRAQSSTADSGGYFLWQSGGTIRINYKTTSGAPQVQLASASFTPVAGTWYTYEFSVVNNSAGLPVLTGYVWARGTAKPPSPTLQVTDTINRFAQGVFSLGKTGTSVNDYDNVVFSGRIGDSFANVVPGNQSNTIAWTNPVYANYTGTMVRSSTVAYPTSITDGTLVGNVAGASGAKNDVVHSGLTNGTRYYYTLFPYDNLSSYGTPTYLSQIAYSALFAENFNALTPGNVVGQNNWTSSGGTWNVGTVLGRTVLIASGTATYPTNRAINGGSQTTDQILTNDFLSDTASNTAGYVWLRRQADGTGYIVWHSGNAWQISYYTGAALTTIASAVATAAPPMEANVWFHQEVSVINNVSGLPVITLYVWKDGTDKPITPTLQVTDVLDRFVQGNFAVGKNGGTATADYDNVGFFGTGPAMSITSPAAAVGGAPGVATLSIIDANGTIFVPYIQTSTTLNVAASAGAVPVGGGVQFVLNEGLGSQQTVTDLTASYSASFVGLAKGTYTLDTYVLDTDGVTRLAGEASHDERTNIGIGDIITVIGDSITEGLRGTVDGGTVTSWLDGDAGTVSSDNRNFPQYGQGTAGYAESYFSDLNDRLSAYYGYPVFIMNDGHGGIRADSYQTSDMATAGWQNRQIALQPNKWIVALGNNEANIGYSAATYSANMTSLINTLISTYGAVAGNIYVPYPLYDFRPCNPGCGTAAQYIATYLPAIDTLRATLGLAGGADLTSTFENYQSTDYFDTVHPNATGYVRMARLTALSFMQPTISSISSVAAQQATVNWTSISAYEPTIAGYRVNYGTSSAALTSSATFGDVTSGTITGLTPNTTYYFSVEAFDNDAFDLSYSDESPIMNATTQTMATLVSATTSDTDANGKLDHIVLTFSKDLDAATVTSADFFVALYAATNAVETSPGVVTLTLTEGALYDTGSIPLVTIIGGVSDTLGNVTSSGFITPTDAAPPIIVALTPVNGSTAVLRNTNPVVTFSEPMNTSTVTYTLSPAVTDRVAVWSAGETILTLTHSSLLTPVTPYTLTITGGDDIAGVPFWGALAGVTHPTAFRTVPVGSSGSGGATPVIPVLTLITPNGGDSLFAARNAFISWSSTNDAAIPFVTLAYSIDDGVSYATIATNIPNTGSFAWTVPNVSTTDARVLIKGGDLLTIGAQDASDESFTITGISSGDDADGDTATSTIVVHAGQGRSPYSGLSEPITEVSVGDFIKAPNYATVYMVDTDGKRQPFVDEQTMYTYMTSRSVIKTVTNATLPQMVVGAPMLPNPGTVLVKIQSDPRVYWLEASGTGTALRWITSESLARDVFGAAWADYVIDVPPTLYSRFLRGANIVAPFFVDRTRLRARADLHE